MFPPVHLPQTCWSISNVIKSRVICLFTLSRFFSYNPQRGDCHLSYVNSEFHNFRIHFLLCKAPLHTLAFTVSSGGEFVHGEVMQDAVNEQSVSEPEILRLW